MARYSPGVLPTGLSPLNAVLGGFAEGLEERRGREHARDREQKEEARQKRLDDLKRRIDELNLVRLGFTESLADPAADPGTPSNTSEAVMSLDGLVPAPTTRTKDGFSAIRPAPSSWDGEVTPDLFADMQRAGRPTPPPTPGAYVPGQGFAGVPTSRFAQPRPVRLPSGGFYDPSLDGQARREEIALRGNQALTLEGERQKGRETLRSSINNNNLVGITLRALLAGENDAASDARDAARGEAHDNRVTNRVNAPGGAGGDKPAAEANRMRVGAAVVAALNGSYDGAVDWLKNTPEGRAAAARGLREDHLFAGLGTYIDNQQRLSVDLQRGVTGMHLGEAEDVRAGARTSATPPRRQPPGTPTGMAGIRAGAGRTPPASDSTTAKTPITADEAKELRKLGFTDEQIAKKYIIR